MKNLYLILNLGSILIPFLVSFHPRLKFYKKWKSLLLATIITSAFFISWDILFTKNGFWGFNPDYYLGYTIANLPIEEWLFFICIPYACVFMHYSLIELMPKAQLSKKSTKLISYSLTALFLVLTIIFHQKWYTFINFGYAFILTLLVSIYELKLLQRFLWTYLFMLIPFFIINGILTGSGIENEVVWYNNNENLGIRMFTIPIEDSIYAFTMILSNLVLLEFFEKRQHIVT